VVYKNVQRRVYDALNVFMAIGVVCKEEQGMVRFLDNNPKNSIINSPTDLAVFLNKNKKK